jgi:hypothetical protein
MPFLCPFFIYGIKFGKQVKNGVFCLFKTIIVTKVKKVSKKVVTMKKNLSFGKRI